MNVWAGIPSGCLHVVSRQLNALNAVSFLGVLQTVLENITNDLALSLQQTMWFQLGEGPPHNGLNRKGLLKYCDLFTVG